MLPTKWNQNENYKMDEKNLEHTKYVKNFQTKIKLTIT